MYSLNGQQNIAKNNKVSQVPTPTPTWRLKERECPIITVQDQALNTWFHQNVLRQPW